MPAARLKKLVDACGVPPPILYKKPEPIGDVTVMVPRVWPVMVCVIPAIGVMVIPKQGSTGTGTGGGVVSDFEHPPIRADMMIRK